MIGFFDKCQSYNWGLDVKWINQAIRWAWWQAWLYVAVVYVTAALCYNNRHKHIYHHKAHKTPQTKPTMTQAQPITAHNPLNLGGYLQAVKLSIDEIFDHDVWVVCEIRAMNSKSGHYYFELADKDDDDNITASCRATLWRYTATHLLKKFQQSTQLSLQAGLKVLLRGRAVFHSQYGFSFNINDISPSYTLGELAQAYHAMKNKLIDNGLLDLNKSLPMPFDIQKVLVIAPENAAGLGDFRVQADRLQACGACHFDYRHATFQGNHAPEHIRTIISTSLHAYHTQGQLPDIMVIIRGGGAVGDLAYLNDYELAAIVAESPVPVWVGIGHERDTVILDEVAHSRFDTPSKVIAAIERYLAERWLGGQAYFDNISRLAHTYLSQQQANLNTQLHKLHSHSLQACLQQKTQNQAFLASIKKDGRFVLSSAKHSQQSLLERHKIIFNHLQTARGQHDYYRQVILSYHPTQVLNKGYALIHDDQGKLITSQKQVSAGMNIHIRFKDGQVLATVN